MPTIGRNPLYWPDGLFRSDDRDDRPNAGTIARQYFELGTEILPGSDDPNRHLVINLRGPLNSETVAPTRYRKVLCLRDILPLHPRDREDLLYTEAGRLIRQMLDHQRLRRQDQAHYESWNPQMLPPGTIIPRTE